MNLPTPEEIDALHHKYARHDSAYALIHEHCEIVWRIAKQLIEKHRIDVDEDMVRVGCLLHDIGVYEYYDEAGVFNHEIAYTEHAVRGQRILEKEALPLAISTLVSHHLGAGLSAEDVRSQHIPIPVQDYTPQTKEERLVAYADKFHSKSHPTPQFNSFEWYKNFCAQFGDAQQRKFAAMSEEFGVPNLAPLAVEYGYAIRKLDAE